MEVLKEPKLKVEMFVKFVPILILHMDKEIISLCLQRPDLEPRQLIPAFIRYQQTKEGTLHQKNNQALLYLQKVIQPESIFSKNFANDPAIHNYLLSMYVKLPDDSLLLEYLKNSKEMPFYDKQYALRLCTQEKKVKGCVEIYSTMKLFDEAATLALTVDVDLAREIASL